MDRQLIDAKQEFAAGRDLPAMPVFATAATDMSRRGFLGGAAAFFVAGCRTGGWLAGTDLAELRLTKRGTTALRPSLRGERSASRTFPALRFAMRIGMAKKP